MNFYLHNVYDYLEYHYYIIKTIKIFFIAVNCQNCYKKTEQTQTGFIHNIPSV